MRRPLVLGIIAVLCVSSCGSDKVKTVATRSFYITGTALDASGRPLVGAQVRLLKEADIGDVGQSLRREGLPAGTVALSCLLPGGSVCHSAHVAIANAVGNYGFKFTDKLAPNENEGPLDVVITAAGASATAPITVLTIGAAGPDVRLPDARVTDSAARVTQTAAQIRLGWSAPPAALGIAVDYSVELYNGQHLLWSHYALNARGQAGAARSEDIDSRLVEDTTGATAAVTISAVLGGVGYVTVPVSYLSARLPVRPSAGAPPSRHRPCSAVSETTPTALTITPQPGCPVTDGNLSALTRLSAPHTQTITGIVVDLGTIRPVRLVVERVIPGRFILELSSDGIHFHQVGTSGGGMEALAPRGAPAARYVRLRETTGRDASLMGEISIW